jgi:FG-GAP repeat
VVGAFSDNEGAGRAYVYLGQSTGLATAPSVTLEAPDGGRFGISVAAGGDSNGDGYGDIAVAAESAGKGYVCLGGPGGPATTPTFTIALEANHEPGAIAWIGDLDGDARADFAIASLEYGICGLDIIGSVGVYRGSDLTSPPLLLQSNVAGDCYGCPWPHGSHRPSMVCSTPRSAGARWP